MRPPHILTTPQQQHVRFAKPLVHSCRRHRAAAVRAYFAFFAIDGAVAVAVEAGQETGLIASMRQQRPSVSARPAPSAPPLLRSSPMAWR